MATYVSDNFNRADNPATMGNAPTGQTWVSVGGAAAPNPWGITSNAAYMNIVDVPFVINQGFTIVDAGSPDSISQVTILNAAAGGGLGLVDQGLVFRWASDQWFWMVVYSTALGRLRLMESRDGFQGAVDGFDTALVNGDVIKAACCGTTINIYLNAALIMSTVALPGDITTTDGTFYGMESEVSTAHFDDFLVTTNGTCTPTYNCTVDGCVDPGDGSGTYATLELCETACSITPSWNCTDGVCVDPGDGSGTFASLLECQQSGCGSIHTAESEVFDAGEGSAYYLVGQVTDSGDELRSKTVKSIRETGIRTNASGMIFGYDIHDPIDIADLETGTRSNTRMITRPQAFIDSTSVSQSERKPVDISNAVLHTFRIEGDDTGNDQRDRIDEVVCEVAKQGVRR